MLTERDLACHAVTHTDHVRTGSEVVSLSKLRPEKPNNYGWFSHLCLPLVQ